MADSSDTPSTSRVHIFGQSLSIHSTASTEYMQLLANYVTEHMERISNETPLTPLAQVAMLACMNISHELHTTRKEYEAQSSRLDHRTRELLENLDSAFAPGKTDDD